MQDRSELCKNYFEVNLRRDENGLGFSIAGGSDNPLKLDDCSVFITKIVKGGSAARDKNLQINDKILKINDITISHMTHSEVVNILKDSGESVKLVRNNFFALMKNFYH